MPLILNSNDDAVEEGHMHESLPRAIVARDNVQHNDFDQKSTGGC